MGVFGEINSAINLVTKAKELADQMKNLELKGVIVDLQGKLLDLKEEIVGLREENAELKQKIAEAPFANAAPKEKFEILYSCYYFDGDKAKLYCPRCYETQSKKHIVSRVSGIGHKCTVCGNIIHF